MIRVTLMVVFGMSLLLAADNLLLAADKEGTERKPGASGKSQPVTIEVIKLEGQTATVRAKGRNFDLKVGPGVTLKVGDRGRVELSEDKTILGFSSETSRENESNEGRIKEPDGTNKAGADSRSKKGSKPQSYTEETAVKQARVAWPSMCTVQAPHCAIPQPNFVPLRFRTSRTTHNRGISGSASACTALPLICSSTPPPWGFAQRATTI